MQNLIAIAQISLATAASFGIALMLECTLLWFLFRLLAHVPEAGPTSPSASAAPAEFTHEIKRLASKQSPRIPMQ